MGLRFAVLAGALLTAVGLAGTLAGGPLSTLWLTATLGPTAYVILAHPRDATSRRRNGIIGHLTAVGAGLLALAVFGLWHDPSIAVTHTETPAQIGAQATALGLTLLVLELADAHHAPAAATSLLVAGGLAAPGPPLLGLGCGLVIVLLVAPLLARLPGHPHDTAGIDAQETPMG